MRTEITRRTLFLGATAARPAPFRLGVVADVQYADKETAGRRNYRAALGRLEACVAEFNRSALTFAIQLGDLVDGGAENYTRILKAFNRIRAPRYHVRGNHDAEFAKARYYDFAARGWRCVVLDGMDVNVTQPAGEAMLAQLKGRPNATTWNGAVGERQKQWLEGVLAAASRRRERALVFCHFPVAEGSATPPHLLWNAGEIVAILERHAAVAAFFNGHDHRGGYAERNGIHYVTVPGMVEGGAGAVVTVHPERIELPGRVLRLR